MFTTVAFSELLATPAVMAEIAAVPDQTHRTSLDDLYIGKFNELVGECAIGAQIQDAYITSPSLRRVSQKYIAPLFIHPSDYHIPVTWNWHGDSPLPLATNEAVNAFAEESSVSAAHCPTIGMWLSDKEITPVKGVIWTVKASASGTFNQKAWNNVALNITPDLPVGRYQIVGVRCYMVDGGLFRFNFVGDWFRPGGVCISEYAMATMPWQRNGGMGVWGEFDAILQPTIDLLPQAVAGETEAYLRIDLIKVS